MSGDRRIADAVASVASAASFLRSKRASPGIAGPEALPQPTATGVAPMAPTTSARRGAVVQEAERAVRDAVPFAEAHHRAQEGVGERQARRAEEHPGDEDDDQKM